MSVPETLESASSHQYTTSADIYETQFLCTKLLPVMQLQPQTTQYLIDDIKTDVAF